MHNLQDFGNVFPFFSSWRLAFEHGPLLSLFKVPENLYFLGAGCCLFPEYYHEAEDGREEGKDGRGEVGWH